MLRCLKKIKESIRGKIITSFICYVILPFIILNLLSFQIYQNYAKKTYGSYMLESLSMVQDQLDNKSRHLVESTMSYYYSGLVELITKKEFNEEMVSKIKAGLSSVMNSYQGISAIYLEIDGRIVNTGMNYQNFIESVDPYKEELIKKGGKHVWLPVTYLVPKKESGYKFIMGKVLNSKNKKNIARLYIVVNEEKMSQVFNNMEMEEGIQYLIDPNSNIMYCSQRDKITKDIDMSTLGITGKSGYYIGKVNNIKSLIVYHLSYQTNWTAVITIPMNNILKDFTPIKIIIIITAIVYIMFLIFMIVLLEKDVFTPVRILTTEMDSFASGNFHVKIDRKASGELGKMNDHFNNMTVRLVDLMKKNEQAVKEKNDFKMQALTAQLNPHFVYNSLNTIKWMAVINKQDNIQGLTNALINILMNSSKVKDDYYTLKDELGLIRDYEIIQKARFMNFNIEYRIEDCAMGCKVRKFLVQPIVENAIIHGFCGDDKMNNSIIITAFCDNNLHIQVKDNGEGFDVEAWRSKENCVDKNHTNIALKSIEQIIELEYGTEYGITIISERGVGTRIDYLLPIIREEFV